ncbi:MarC family protein, partial [Akkermansia sp.]
TYAAAIITAWLLSGLVLFIAHKFLRLLGEKGTVALERLMGMVLIMISVQMFMNGLAGYGVK